MSEVDIIAKIQDMSLLELEGVLGEETLYSILRDYAQDQYEAGRITANEVLAVYEGDQ